MAEPWQYGLEEAIGYAREREAQYHAIYIDGRNMNQPYIYVLFYARWPPSEVHQTLEVKRDPPAGIGVEGIGRYRFQTPDYRPEELDVLHVIRDPEGRPRYEVREGEAVPSGERVLLVRRP